MDRDRMHAMMPDFVYDIGSCIKRPVDSEVREILLNSEQTREYRNNVVSTSKYNVFTFLPIFLFEQFRRYANLFFLGISLSQLLFASYSPTGRWNTFGPLCGILALTACKHIWEDLQRHRTDTSMNTRKMTILRGGQWVVLKWRDLVVGDFVKIEMDESFPADILLFSSPAEHGGCYIETANLDGETNLKIREAVPATTGLNSEAALTRVSGKLECDAPNKLIYDYKGALTLGNEHIPLGPDQVLLRGAVLRNTAWVIGVAVYTGHESKLMMNSSRVPLKQSNMDRITNKQIIFMLAILFVISVTCMLVSVLANIMGGHHYVQDDVNEGRWYYFLLQMLTFVILFNNLVPISLLVTVEFVKLGQAFLINNDLDMYHEKTDTPACARTSNLNEELGQIQYVFSDKTGTLTQNVMIFKQCSIDNEVYGQHAPEGTDYFLDEAFQNRLAEGSAPAKVDEFLTQLAVCHTVVPDYKPDGSMIYQASSPDEFALVNGAALLGYKFTSRSPDSCTITIRQKDYVYQTLCVLHFTSTRKRMSVIVRMPDGRVRLMTKGADMMIYDRLRANDPLAVKTQVDLNEFAALGLRTLCLAYVDLSDAEYSQWRSVYDKAALSLDDREKEISDACELIERNLTLLGASAIEDKLQDGVPHAIATLLQANIKVWVLTGDKQETAMNICCSCNLLQPGMTTVILNSDEFEPTQMLLQKHLKELGDRVRKENFWCLVVDGKTLYHCLKPELEAQFLNLALSCKSVLVCRASPRQKADIVDMVKTKTGSITLAIGDGANDVGMIQAAHIGVGISGLEGLQAVAASDYSIAQFRYLLKLLLCHGSWSFTRLSKVVLYMFYKNVVLYLCQFWFCFLNGFSGQVIFDAMFITIYNGFFTFVQPMALGIFDIHCPAKTLMENPHLYRTTQSSAPFNSKIFWQWMATGIFHSFIVFWLHYVLFDQGLVMPGGYSTDIFYTGNYMFSVVMIVVTVKVALETDQWNMMHHLAYWGSLVAWYLFFIVYSLIYPGLGIGTIGSRQTGMLGPVFGSCAYWFALILIPFIALYRDITWKLVSRAFFPPLEMKVQQSNVTNNLPPGLCCPGRTAAADNSGVELLAGNSNRSNSYTYEATNISG